MSRKQHKKNKSDDLLNHFEFNVVAMNGQPVPLNEAGEIYVSCCDCGLVHLFKIISADDRICLVGYRDDYLTSQARKGKRT